MTVMSDRDATIAAMVTARAWRDEEYLAELVRNPREVLADEGMRFSPDVELRVVVNTDTVRYVHITKETTDKAQVVPVITDLIPLTEAQEIRIVQSTDTVEYLVIAAPPAGLDVMAVPETRLIYSVPSNNTYQVVNYVEEVNEYASTLYVAAEGGVAVVVGIVAVLT